MPLRRATPPRRATPGLFAPVCFAPSHLFVGRRRHKARESAAQGMVLPLRPPQLTLRLPRSSLSARSSTTQCTPRSRVTRLVRRHVRPLPASMTARSAARTLCTRLALRGSRARRPASLALKMLRCCATTRCARALAHLRLPMRPVRSTLLRLSRQGSRAHSRPGLVHLRRWPCPAAALRLTTWRLRTPTRCLLREAASAVILHARRRRGAPGPFERPALATGVAPPRSASASLGVG